MNVTHTTVDGREVSAMVVEGTIRDNLKRATLMREQLTDMKEQTDEPKFMVIENLLRLNTFPSCMAATTEFHDSAHPDMDIKSMTFEVFLDVPDQFLTKWIGKVFEYNPGWQDDNVGPRVRPPSKEDASK